MRVLEVGTGPGTYGLAIGRAVECAELLLNDISPLSIDMVGRIAAVDPVRRPDTLHFSTSDFLELDPPRPSPSTSCCSARSSSTSQIRRAVSTDLGNLLAPGAVVFFSTATNAAFYDHTIVFETVDEIEALLRRHDFEVISSRTIFAAPGPDGRDVNDYAAVMRPARRHRDGARAPRLRRSRHGSRAQAVSRPRAPSS